jgi:transposase InsO family protein
VRAGARPDDQGVRVRRAWRWLIALNRAVNRQFPGGIEGQRLNLMADNGYQPISLAFMRACAALGIRQAFTSYSNPKGNADTERFLRALKEELVWLREWSSPAAFFVALDRWLSDDLAPRSARGLTLGSVDQGDGRCARAGSARSRSSAF